MAAEGAGEKMQQIPINQLSIQQLDQIKKDIDQEIGILTESVNQLKIAQQKFSDSLDNLGRVTVDKKGKELMVPMTSSMYVPGFLDDTSTVMVDIGTGYYVEKSVEDGKKYFRRKIEFVGKQVEKIHPALLEKQRARSALIEALSAKVSQQMSQQQLNSKVEGLKT
ncbi:prefoldin subunit 5-like [Hydractinia symbiolongicarpus]|uniref:prefoldin subunit 5-like n=1 Tax=Hydractinia symbiolongicarpus TaxID=13093 RepID=UPI00254F0F0B|nr:prefoldin subunit 5-like [Hydractinia symbiolongicarpus]